MLSNYDRDMATTPDGRYEECPECLKVAADLAGHDCRMEDDE